MTIEIVGDKYLTVDMKNFILKVLEDIKGPVRYAFSPRCDKHFNVQADSKSLNEDDKVYFHRMVARLLYVAKKPRLEILPTKEDLKKLKNIFGYLSKHRDNVMRYLRGKDISFLLAYIGASFGIHHGRTWCW